VPGVKKLSTAPGLAGLMPIAARLDQKLFFALIAEKFVKLYA